jgi:hypothetical protein
MKRVRKETAHKKKETKEERVGKRHTETKEKK